MNSQPDERPSGETVLLAILLFLFGEKSLALAKLSMVVFQLGQVKEKYMYEFALYGLMVGTCVVVVISLWRRHTLKQDNLTLLTGLVIATLAGLFNIGEAIIEHCGAGNVRGCSNLDDIPGRALFFFGLWILLVIVPGFTRLFRSGDADGFDTGLLFTIVSVLLVAVVFGAAMRQFTGAVIWLWLEFPDVEKITAGVDKLRFRPDTLIQLGAVWIIATFATFRGAGELPRRIVYLALAPLGGATYAYVFKSDPPPPNVGVTELVLGYSALSAAAIVPVIFFAKGILVGSWKAAGYASLAVFAACVLAMYLGLANTWDVAEWKRLVMSLLQGAAGACTPVCAVLGVRFIMWVQRRGET